MSDGERYCVECEHRWVDESPDYKLCPKCGASAVIRPPRANTGVKILEIRGGLYQQLKPLFEHTKVHPEYAEQDAQDATERALGYLLKRLVH